MLVNNETAELSFKTSMTSYCDCICRNLHDHHLYQIIAPFYPAILTPKARNNEQNFCICSKHDYWRWLFGRFYANCCAARVFMSLYRKWSFGDRVSLSYSSYSWSLLSYSSLILPFFKPMEQWFKKLKLDTLAAHCVFDLCRTVWSVWT